MVSHDLETLAEGVAVVPGGVAAVKEVCHYGMDAPVGQVVPPAFLENLYAPVDIG